MRSAFVTLRDSLERWYVELVAKAVGKVNQNTLKDLLTILEPIIRNIYNVRAALNLCLVALDLFHSDERLRRSFVVLTLANAPPIEGLVTSMEYLEKSK